MNVSYRGIKKDLPVKLQEKLETKFAKLSKLIDGRGEKKAHVVVTSERHLQKAEITVHIHNHQLVGIGIDADLFTAMNAALHKIETQALKDGEKWRAMTRRSEPMKANAAKEDGKAPAKPPTAAKPPARKTARTKVAAATATAGPRVFRPNHHERRKPITVEEALLQMEDGREYLAYRDAEKQSVSILVRRRDGHFDLIES
jgi:putative sigma-54 modulation protein